MNALPEKVLSDAVKEFIDMVEQALHRAQNGEAQPLYLQAIENLTDKPQYNALKTLLDKSKRK